MSRSFDIVILGLTITSSWGNGHATTYRSLVRGLAARGHRVLFLEKDAPWYAENRDQPQPVGAVTEIYRTFDELNERFDRAIEEASLVIVGSYIPEGVRIGEWVVSTARGKTAFYDIDTPVTLRKLAAGESEYLSPLLIRRYDMYLSFTGGPTLRLLESRYGSPMAREFYCSIDPEVYRPVSVATRWDMGYLGTYGADRQGSLDMLLLEPARRSWSRQFIVAGSQYPDSLKWPRNVERTIHLSPREHPFFYGAQRFTLNVTRDAMKKSGYSPSVRLFEAGACGTPVISDWWQGLDSFFQIGKEVLVAENAEDILRILRDMSQVERVAIADAARRRVLSEHSSDHRAVQLEKYWKELNDNTLPGAPRRNGGVRRTSYGMADRLPPQRLGEDAGATSGGKTIATADPSRLHESSGADSRDGQGDCQAPQVSSDVSRSLG